MDAIKCGKKRMLNECSNVYASGSFPPALYASENEHARCQAQIEIDWYGVFTGD